MDSCSVYHILPPADKERDAAAVIVAAGGSTRMGGVSKQLALLNDMPVIAHAVKAFQEAKHIGEIVIVARPEDVAAFSEVCRQYHFDRVSTVVTGGSSRQQSVCNGIGCIKDHAAYLAIHDGARPLIRPETIDRVIERARLYGAAAAAVPAKDTIKISDENGFVRSTPDRQLLWSVQTPQVFEKNLYLKAIEYSAADEKCFTDDCQLVEQIGHKVYLVKSDYDNIKITTPEDITIARCLLNTR